MAAMRALVCARTRGRRDGSSPSKRPWAKFGESLTKGRIAPGEAPIRFMTRMNCRDRVREETFSMTDERVRTLARSEVPRLRIGDLSV
jgi:hypothetical protein